MDGPGAGIVDGHDSTAPHSTAATVQDLIRPSVSLLCSALLWSAAGSTGNQGRRVSGQDMGQGVFSLLGLTGHLRACAGCWNWTLDGRALPIVALALETSRSQSVTA